MISRRIGTAALVAFIVAGLLSSGVEAAPLRLVQKTDAEAPGVSLSRKEAADIARSHTGGRVLSVELRGDGQPWYRVKVLVSDERVRTLRIDARTGSIR